jgi:predicted amino acid racemase
MIEAEDRKLTYEELEKAMMHSMMLMIEIRDLIRNGYVPGALNLLDKHLRAVDQVGGIVVPPGYKEP